MDAGAGSFGEMLRQFVAQSLVKSTSFLIMGLRGAAVKERFIKLCMGWSGVLQKLANCPEGLEMAVVQCASG